MPLAVCGRQPESGPPAGCSWPWARTEQRPPGFDLWDPSVRSGRGRAWRRSAL